MSDTSVAGMTSREVPFTKASTALQKFAEELGDGFGTFVENANKGGEYVERIGEFISFPLQSFYNSALSFLGYATNLEFLDEYWRQLPTDESRQIILMQVASAVGLESGFQLTHPHNLMLTMEQLAKFNIVIAVQFWDEVILQIMAHWQASKLLRRVTTSTEYIQQSLGVPIHDQFFALVRVIGNRSTAESACRLILNSPHLNYTRCSKAILRQMLNLRS